MSPGSRATEPPVRILDRLSGVYLNDQSAGTQHSGVNTARLPGGSTAGYARAGSTSPETRAVCGYRRRPLRWATPSRVMGATLFRGTADDSSVADAIAGSETCQQPKAVAGEMRASARGRCPCRSGWEAPVAFDAHLLERSASERLETAARRAYRDQAGLRPETTQTEPGPRTEPSSVTNRDSTSRMSAAMVGRISSIRSPH
jgi:hypothetical protein